MLFKDNFCFSWFLEPKLTRNSCSSCLCPQSAGVKGVFHPSPLQKMFKRPFKVKEKVRASSEGRKVQKQQQKAAERRRCYCAVSPPPHPVFLSNSKDGLLFNESVSCSLLFISLCPQMRRRFLCFLMFGIIKWASHHESVRLPPVKFKLTVWLSQRYSSPPPMACSSFLFPGHSRAAVPETVQLGSLAYYLSLYRTSLPVPA